MVLTGRQQGAVLLRGLSAAALVAVALVGCGEGERSLQEVDPAAAPAFPSWSAHVAPIVARRCAGCHRGGGAMAGLEYATCEDLRSGWGGVVVTVFTHDTMPPGGADRVTSSERLTLERWYEGGAPCP